MFKKIAENDICSVSHNEIDLGRDDNDLKGVFDTIWGAVVTSPEESMMVSLNTITDHRQNFIKSFKSEDNFKKVDEKEQHRILRSIEAVSRISAKLGKYAVCNGTAVFQIWLMTLVKEDISAKEHIELTMAEFRTKIFH